MTIKKAPAAILGIMAAVLLVLVLSWAPHAHSAGSPITGWAWSSNIGWISLNCSSDPGGCSGLGGNWGLSTDGSGNITGDAWGDNIGWISANPADTASCGTQGNLLNGLFTGWLRALNTGGDGCINLSGSGYQATTVANPNYNNATDYAWGSDTVGWLSFNASGGTCTATSITCSDSTHYNSYTDASCVVHAAGVCGSGLVCVNGFGCTNAPAVGCISAGVDVRSPSSCAVAATTAKVVKGNSLTLYWSVQNVSSCSLTGNGQSGSGTSGSANSGAINSQTTFTLTCAGGGTWTVTVNAVPTYKEL